MKLAIIRTSKGMLDLTAYNVQEIGLAKGLLKVAVSTDIYSLFKGIDGETILFDNGNNQIRLIPLHVRVVFGKITFCLKKDIKKIINKGYDIIQVHEDSQLMTPFILGKAKRKGIKTVLYQGMYTDYAGIQKTYNLFLDMFAKNIIRKNVDFIIAKTDTAKQYLIRKGYKNVFILPVGLDSIEQKNITIDSGIENIKKQYKTILLYVGKIEARRNPKFLIDVLSETEEDTALIVVGKGPLSNYMKDYADRKGVIDRLLMIDFIPNNEIFNVYKTCDVFLLPTNNEIYGMVVMEALLNGLPVISTPEAGPLFILTNERLGICLPMDAEAWVDKICFYEKTNAQDDFYYRKEYVKKQFNWGAIAERYCEIINNQ